MHRRHATAFAAVALLAAGCLATTDESPVPAEFGPRVSGVVPGTAASLAHESYSGLTDRTRAVITDAAAWNGVWSNIYAGVSPVPAVPAVDFAGQGVIVAAMGSRPSGGFAITIDSVVRYQAGIVVHVTSVAPGATCATTAAITAPVHAVRVDRPVEPAVFRERAATLDCS